MRGEREVGLDARVKVGDRSLAGLRPEEVGKKGGKMGSGKNGVRVDFFEA
jgi:hypothetical protein